MLDNASARLVLSRIVTPVAQTLIRLKVTADAVTCFGAVATIACAAIFIPTGHFLLASLTVGLLSLSDLLDGTIARLTQSDSRWGAFLDSTLDRVVDAAVLIAVAAYFLNSKSVETRAVVATVIALVMGQMTSYIRAKAEALGVECKVGLAERAERTFVVWIALLISGLGWYCLPWAMYLLAVITSITVAQRVSHVRKQLAA